MTIVVDNNYMNKYYTMVLFAYSTISYNGITRKRIYHGGNYHAPSGHKIHFRVVQQSVIKINGGKNCI